MSTSKPPANVASRFVSQTELSEAQQKREDAVRQTYARLGQEPPPEALAAARGEQETYDPRTLYERLKANRDAKQEAIDEKLKLSNQFRGIDDGESVFLADVAREKQLEEQRKKQEVQRELDEFRRAALEKAASPPVQTSTSPPASSLDAKTNLPSSSAVTSKTKAKRKREGLPGIVKKKRSDLSKGNGATEATAPSTAGKTVEKTL